MGQRSIHLDRKRIIMVGTVVAVAGAAGVFVQSRTKGPAVPQQSAVASAPAPAAGPHVASAMAPATSTAQEPAAAPILAVSMPALAVAPAGATSGPGAGLMPELAPAALETGTATPPPPVQLARPVMTAPPPPALVPPGPALDADAATTTACTDDIALIPQPGAMIDIGLLSPCRAGERIVIRHGGLVVTGLISPGGSWIGSIPALEAQAEVVLSFADGSRVSAETEVPDLGQYDRFAVQWMDGDAFGIHAFEAGAEFGDAGHVWAETPRRANAAGGFLNTLGDAATDRPLLAQVYTWPAGVSGLAGGVAVVLEAAVTETTCGRDLIGETLQLTAGRLTVRDLTLAMPGCEATGEFVMLHNPLESEQHAAN